SISRCSIVVGNFIYSFYSYCLMLHPRCGGPVRFDSLLSEIPHRVAEDVLRLVAGDVAEQVGFVTLRVSHLAEYPTVATHDTLDGVIGAVGVERRPAGRHPVGIGILESHLACLEKLLSLPFVHHELTLAVADGDGMQFARTESGEPRRIR